MARKQLSGYQKRVRARARAQSAGVLMPQPPPLAELNSLTGVIREKGRCYRAWKTGKLPHEQYLISIRGLSALATAITAREAERQREADERLAAAIEAGEARQAGVPLLDSPPVPASSVPMEGELMPRETDDGDADSREGGV